MVALPIRCMELCGTIGLDSLNRLTESKRTFCGKIHKTPMLSICQPGRQPCTWGSDHGQPVGRNPCYFIGVCLCGRELKRHIVFLGQALQGGHRRGVDGDALAKPFLLRSVCPLAGDQYLLKTCARW